MMSGIAFALLLVSSSAQILQTAAPAPQAAVPSAGSCMSGQTAGQLTNAGTGTISVASDVATVRFLPTLDCLLLARSRFSRMTTACQEPASLWTYVAQVYSAFWCRFPSQYRQQGQQLRLQEKMLPRALLPSLPQFVR